MPLAKPPVLELYPICDISQQHSNDEHGALRSTMMLLRYLSVWRIKGVLHYKVSKWAYIFSVFPLCIMQLIYSDYVVHLQSDHINEDIQLQWNYLIMLLQQFSALVKLVAYENREKHRSFQRQIPYLCSTQILAPWHVPLVHLSYLLISSSVLQLDIFCGIFSPKFYICFLQPQPITDFQCPDRKKSSS